MASKWTDEERRLLAQLRAEGVPTTLIAQRLGRSPRSIACAAFRFGLPHVPEEVARQNSATVNASMGRTRQLGYRLSKAHREAISRGLRASEKFRAALPAAHQKMRQTVKTPAVREKCRQAALKGVMKRRAKLIPPPFRAEYNRLRNKRIPAAEIRKLLKPQVDAWLRTLEGQLWKLQTGARLVEKVQAPAQEYHRSLIGCTLERS